MRVRLAKLRVGDYSRNQIRVVVLNGCLVKFVMQTGFPDAVNDNGE